MTYFLGVTLKSFGSTLLNLLYFIIALGVLVTIHEFGHFITAKKFGVYVNEFSIGFGPLIFKKKKGETTYSLRALPLGGYCSMAGEGMEEGEMANLPKERYLQGIAKWKRAIIMVAGVFLNFVLAFFLFIGYFASTPQITEKATNLIVTNIKDGEESPLMKSGYKSENIQKIKFEYIINGLDASVPTVVEFNEIKGYQSLNEALTGGIYTLDGKQHYYTPLTKDDKKTVTFYCEGDKEYTMEIAPYVATSTGAEETYQWNLLGARYVTHRLNFFQVIGAAFVEVGSSSILILKAFGTLFTPQGIASVGGPIAVFQVSSQAASYGFGAFVWLWGVISVNLAVFNLLPFPGLDGWHFLVIIVEAITRKEMPAKVKGIMSGVGFLLLLLLMILVSIKDIIGLF